VTENIPALIAEADDYAQRGWGDISEFAARVSKALKRRAKRADALESLSSPPATDDDREALVALVEGAVPHDIPGWRVRYSERIADAVLASRRPSPLTREALEDLISSLREMGADTSGDLRDWMCDAAKSAADALSRFSLPEPAEVEWEYRVVDSAGEHVWPFGTRDEEEGETLEAVQEALDENFWSDDSDTDPNLRIEKRRQVIPAGPWVPVKGAEQ
jgi:hypothetical protein